MFKTLGHRPFLLLLGASLLVSGCAARAPVATPSAHLGNPAARLPAIAPPPLSPSLMQDKPLPLTYTLAVNQVNVQDFLFALARDTGQNIDIHPAVQGLVSLNVANQTLPQILDRLSAQIDLRHEFRNGVLRILPDTPYLVHYPIDYVNIQRQMNATVSANTQIASGQSLDPRGVAQASSPAGNISNTRLENGSSNQFWATLERNLQEILRETDKALPEGNTDTYSEEDRQHNAAGLRTPATTLPRSSTSRGVLNQPLPPPVPQAETSTSRQKETLLVRTRTFREAASVIVNPEGGLVSVRATARQHETVRDFLQQVLETAHRQVLIEATIVEVELSEGYQQGIDWSRVRSDGSQAFSLSRADIGGDPSSGLLPFSLRNRDDRDSLGVQMAIDLLRAFGQVKVLSSPRIAVLNNQTALLKVVENVVYFNVKADTLVTANVGQTTTVTTTPQSVSVGLVMAVTPQISSDRQITLNVRPTISSIAKFVPDPNPVIPIPNQVPQIRTREIESMLRLNEGEIAVLGGLMEDKIDRKSGQVPGLADIPLLGEFFTTRNQSSRKSELVVFLRPNPSRDHLKSHLPDRDYFQTP